MNTSRQIGGAIGLAAVSTIAATTARHYAESHLGSTPLSPASLTHGFHAAFYVLTGLAVLGAILAAAFIEPQRRAAKVGAIPDGAAVRVEEAA